MSPRPSELEALRAERDTWKRRAEEAQSLANADAFRWGVQHGRMCARVEALGAAIEAARAYVLRGEEDDKAWLWELILKADALRARQIEEAQAENPESVFVRKL